MQYPASQPDPTSIIPGHLIHTIIRPALLLILLLFSSFSALALAYGCKVDGIYYDITPANRTASVTRVSYSGGVIIPETIAFDGTTYSVTSIGDGAFANHSGLTSVTIPNSVTSIGNYAFFNCSGLTSVTIPNSVTTIGDSAFFGCCGLSSVTFNAEKCTEMGAVNSRVFSGCTNLATLTIGDKVTIIPDYAFTDCSGLTSITIPNSVTFLGEGAFSNCSRLTSVTIPNSVTSIGRYAFKYCSKLTSVTIGNSVTTIDRYAFFDCSGLTSVTIPNSVTSIGDYAFAFCSGLTSVTIPNSVTSIGEFAFRGCSGLTSVTVDKNNGTYDSRDNCNAIIETSTNKLIVGCKNTTIPNSVTSIGYGAFHGCSKLTSVTIPNSVTSIGYGAFAGCSGLTKLTSWAVEPPTCDERAFEAVDKTACQLIVPDESINKYKVADQWQEFMNIFGFSGVDDVSVDTQNALYEVYNLQGVRVGSGMREAEITADVLPHGVYILVSPQGRKKLKI